MYFMYVNNMYSLVIVPKHPRTRQLEFLPQPLTKSYFRHSWKAVRIQQRVDCKTKNHHKLKTFKNHKLHYTAQVWI